MDRKDFYFRQRLAQSELDDAFEAAEQSDLNVMADVLGNGFLIDGVNPATVVQAGTPNLTVLANQVLGYDQLGRRLSNADSAFQGGVLIGTTTPHSVDLSIDEVGAATTVTSPGNERILTIFVEFARYQQDPRTDGNATTVFFVRDESVSFNVAQSAEATAGSGVPTPARTDQLILADVTRLFGQTAFLNSDIDQTRREAFNFSILHGFTHVEGGTDAIPNATPSVGGLHSAADKTKLDTITWTPTGIGTTLANTHYRDFQPANGTAPAATTLGVTGLLIGKSATGSPTVEGVLVSPPDNTVILTDTDNDDFLDAFGNKVYGRLTEAAGVWTLSFFSNIDGSGETAFDMTPFSGQDFRWFILEAFFIHNVPSANPLRSVPSDQVAAEVPTATTTVQGKVIAALNSPATPQAGSFNRVLNAGVPLAGGPWNTINLPGGGATDAGGGQVNIPASAGPTGPTGPTGSTGPTGAAGPGFTSEGPYQISVQNPTPTRTSSAVFNFGFTVRMYMTNLSQIPTAGFVSDKVYLSGGSKSGATVTANYVTNDFGTAGGDNFNIGCTAAG